MAVAAPEVRDGDDIRTPDQRIRVFVSSTLVELADERQAVRSAIERLHLTAVMFELGARPHPPGNLYRAYLRQSHVFIGIYHERYGWVAPGEQVSGLEDEFRLSQGMPRLLYLKRPAPNMEPRLRHLLDGVERDGAASYRVFTDAGELAALVQEDLATLLSERFMTTGADRTRPNPSEEAVRPPVPLTGTIGRDADIARVAGLLTTGTRLLTITGPGGIGKSRIALEVARVVADHYVDQVVFVPLENVSDTPQVLRAIAVSVKAADDGTRPVLDVLTDELSARRMLLLIDNMEQVAAAGHELSELLGRCPGVSALITSRHVLRLRGEREYHLGPLPVPYGADDDSIRLVPSVRLFVQRAVAANPDFRLTRANRGAVAELTRALDGLPLAIELAAARTRLLSPAALLERLTERLDVLGDGRGDLPLRQRTLRATLDWSYHLLNPAEQALFARMGVFAGGATLEAIEGICGDEAVPDVLDTVSSLVEKSLLATTVTDTADVPRIVMLQTVRTRARELLAERGDVDTFTARYVQWYADFCEPADVLAHAQAPRRWPALEPEGANLLAVAQWATAHADAALLVSLARRLWPWLWSSGRVGELRDAVARALAAMPSDPAPRDIGYLHYVAAYTQGLTGDFAGALTFANQALREYGQDNGNETTLLVAAARLVRGTLVQGLGQADGVDADMDHAVAVAREWNNAWLLGYATSHRGLRRAMQGDRQRARADHAGSLAVATATGNEVLAAQAIGQIAIIDVLEQRFDQAHAGLCRQVDHLKLTHHLEGLANALDTTAALAVAQHQWETAARAAAAAQRLRDRFRMAPWPLIDEYHNASRAAARRNLGDRAQGIEAEACDTDPWTVIDDALTELQGPVQESRWSGLGQMGEDRVVAVPAHQIRARFSADTITVYQAYPVEIALAAVTAGRFVPPFKRERMTWIKPSFLWMMYRCGWATKPGQERVLAIDITREGFEWALAHACLSHYDSDQHSDQAAWSRQLKASPVRVQWDPERSLHLTPLPYRSLQVGLSGDAVDRYVDEWTVAVTDVTGTAQRIQGLLRAGDDRSAEAQLPVEEPYPLSAGLAAGIDAR